MTPDLAFTLCNVSVGPAWLMLFVAPRWKPGTDLICPVVVPALLALVYGEIFVAQWGAVEGGFATLEGVERIFTNRFALVGGWIHYLAFDLFVGGHEARDARRLGIRRRFLVPCLALTLFFGPLGYLAWVGVRYAARREWLV